MNTLLQNKKLENHLHWLQAIVQFVPVGIFQIDINDKYSFVNPAWESITGCSMPKALGSNWKKVIHPDDQEMVSQCWSKAETEDKELSVECRIVTDKNQTKWVRLQTTFLFDDSGRTVFGSIENITNNKASQKQKEEMIAELTAVKKQLEKSCRTDPLTSLLNRRGMEEEMVFEKNRMERSGKPFSLILCDIDFFKNINDNHGHDAGDYVLTQTAKLIENISRKQDIVCRWGGEEFLLILPETDLKGADALAQKIRKSIESNTIIFNDHKIQLTLSLGVACIQSNDGIDDCIKKADLRLYLAKNSGRNKVVSSDQ